MIYALSVMRNEADRYLRWMLRSLNDAVSAVFVFDDDSTDGTVETCRKADCVVQSRRSTTPSFAESEGGFREAAWRAFEATIHPEVGDWVLAIDADELLVTVGQPAATLAELTSDAAESGFTGIAMPIPEVWAVSPLPTVGHGRGVAQVRVDGEWGRLSAPRLFAYAPGGQWPRQDRHDPVSGPKRQACGSTPDYVQPPFATAAPAAALLHFGYMKGRDRQVKYERYAGQPGHGAAHVTSILSTPTLVDWDGPMGPWE